MKKDTLLDALGLVGDDIVDKACDSKNSKIIYIKRWTAAVAVLLVAVIITTAVLQPLGSGGMSASKYALSIAEYPEMASYPSHEDIKDWDEFEKAWDAWRADKRQQREYGYEGYCEGLSEFFAATASEFLNTEKDENSAYSPLNIYFALCMLAETCSGESRDEILSLLGTEDIADLRKQAKAVWNTNYSDDGMTTEILGSSIWLSEGFEAKSDALAHLKNDYYASVFSGKMGSEGYNEAFRSWLSEQTGGLLDESIENMEFSSETVLAIAATLYFKSSWNDEYAKSKTTEDVFYTEESEVTAEFMHKTKIGEYCYGDKFSAVRDYFEGDGCMWFILPDEGVSIEELLADENALDFIVSGEGAEEKTMIINLSVPKFDVTSDLELTEGLKNLGITEVFDSSIADFSAISDQSEGMYLSDALHSARVKIDEEGVEASAITVMAEAGAAAPGGDEIDFTLDRPFIFVISSADNLPLFIGIINNPTK